ncbi:MAG TPA: mechanosensitive ion channel domain-containing protein [Candidatus Sulfopaludibacter sp.]|jgi:small-conductance mechanosensitive channel|nr:mechanosensitive ion channel domain-containing protein [Candidatus Sulfopaludibacter sp.]
MKYKKNFAAVLVTVLLVACLVAVFETSETANPAAGKKSGVNAPAPVVDDRLLRTARQMAAMADTPDEQDSAREALRLSDHAVDQAFATALREAETPATAVSGEVKRLTAEIDKLMDEVAGDQKRVEQLSKDAETSEAQADQLDIVKAQLALEKDELDDAQQDRARQGGDRHGAIEHLLEEHENNQKASPPLPKLVDPGAASTVFEQVKLWLALRGRTAELEQARQESANQAASLTSQHQALESQPAAAAPQGETTAAKVARLHGLSGRRKTLMEFDKRVQDCQQLASVYSGWETLVAQRQRGLLHRVLGSVALILAILLLVVMVDRAISHAFHQSDRKRLHQVRLISTVAVQLVAVVAILLIVFGPPTQLSTIIGLATAGLTVVMKDFIVAFFGWFTLMGKNGIRVGDWVEIEGISGEVIEIGILKTVLLETGNWSAQGHPTGRQVAFSNSFAMEKHYFNFSTSNQWLWDQLRVIVPPGGDPYEIARQIADTVEQETRQDAAGAAEEWDRVASKYGASSFSAKPAVDLRPGSNGLEVVVRYITKAPRRDQVKSRLFQVIVELLHRRAQS